MHYKTIILELLEQYPEIYQELSTKRKLLQEVELYAKRLKTSHEAWKARLFQRKPESDESQISSEALELALKEIEDSFPSLSPSEEGDAPSLEGAMAFIRRHTPPK
jgi:hypothetical protein